MAVTFQAADTAAQEYTGVAEDSGNVSFYGGSLRSATDDTLRKLGLKQGVEVVTAGRGKLAESGVPSGFVITKVNDKSVSTPQEVIDAAKNASGGVFIEGVHPSGKRGYFAFGK